MNEDLSMRLKNKLKLECYLMNDEWLRDCVEFYVNQHENPNIEEILQFVKIQWQLSDLREINNENGSLPPNLSQRKFIVLSERYILQLEQMYDIGTSKYKQLEQIRNTHSSEVELSEAEALEKWEPPKKRMIQLRLTDGFQDVIGIEYSYISQLNNILLPGYKVMIIGPVKCRRGVLLLEEKNFKGIGGEVDSLLIPNAFENVLARALNLKENPDPYNDNETKTNNFNQQKPQTEDVFFEEDFEINLEDVSRIEDSHSKDHKSVKDAIKAEVKTEIKDINTVTNMIEKEEILDDDDCLLEMIDERQLIETEIEQKHIAAPFRVLPKEENDDIIIINEEEKVTDSECDIFKKTVNSKLFSKKPESSITNSHLKIKKEPQPLLISGKRSGSISPPVIITSKKGKVDRHITEFTKVLNTSEEPKLCEFIHTIKNKIISGTTFKTIRAHIETLGKLTKKNSLWILDATVADGTGTIEVSFSNKVLEDLIGFSVQEFSLKKKLMKDPKIERELRMAFRCAENKMKALDALLKLEMNTNNKPTVIKITDLTQEQKKIIDTRVKDFLLENNT